jgi:hypothetical protein
VPESLIDVVEPFFRVIVELGCDRSIPPWEPTPARLIPMHDPVTAGDLIDPATAGDLIDASAKAINNAPGHHRPVNTANGPTRSSAWTPGKPMMSTDHATHPVLATQPRGFYAMDPQIRTRGSLSGCRSRVS